ncbi:hypothetical protein MVEN_00553100 [Mycena venus]|uniref:Uncharacterized protein n=1 Tax=Mycena venus TaxID=2733690 RepID=A0A8H6YQG9_9AGAR|nr:hypothetical protein MVEN_00553100 [Mycena venus]
MEGPQPPPRLRVPKKPLTAVADRPLSPDEQSADLTRPQDHSAVDGLAGRDDDPQPTPKGNLNSNASLPPGEAAARLRALLRAPNQSNNKTQTRPASPSEIESDFDPPRFSPPPSEVKKSLKDVFSHALREPGDTPVKPGRNRRNSTSEVEDIPRDTAKNKGKRKSLSDEELDKPNRSSLRSEGSFRSSQAATFDILRERLNNSQTPLKNEAAPAPLYDNSSADTSGDTATFFRDLNSSRATPPVATSTPAHSMEIASDSKYHTSKFESARIVNSLMLDLDLMDHDSEMQHMMKDLDSYEGDSGRNRPVSFPSSRGKSTPRPGSSTSQSHRLSYNGHGSRPVSQLGHLHGHDSHHDEPEHLKELEIGWNKPHPKGHERQHSHDHVRSHSPMPGMNGHSRSRTQSGDSGHSSDAHHGTRSVSQMSSHSGTDIGHRDEPEHLKELESGWNKHHPKGPGHERTHSHGPDHARSHSPMVGANGHARVRTQSSSSVHSVDGNLSSRGTSASSHSDYKDRMAEQEKERNAAREHAWNRPQAARSTSTLSVHSPAERNRKLSDVHSPPVERSRKLSQPLRPGSSQSLLSPAITRRPSSRASTSRTSSDEEEEIQHEIEHERERNWNAPIPKWHEHPSHGHHGHHAGPKSPMSPSLSVSTPSNLRPGARDAIIAVPEKTRESDFDKPYSCQSNGEDANQGIERGWPSSDRFAKLGYGTLIPLRKDNTMICSQTETDETDDLPEARTPTAGTIVLPPPEQPPLVIPSPPSPQPVVTSDEEMFQKALSVAPPPSPPPSPPSPSPPTPTIAVPPEPETLPTAPTTFFSSLSTPTKRPSFSSSRMEFQTPSPPKGLPDLPGPPSSDEETETEQLVATPLRFNGAPDISTKTPRPPGAWASTPASVARTNSLPPPEHDESDSQYEGGLATPVPSLSRASSLPAQTPKPPGGWMATPTPRKSILKVRFDPQQNTELELSATEDFSSTNGHPEESCQVSEAATGDEDRVHTPELPQTPVSPSRSPTRSPRRSPTIRVVDAFGRPESKRAKSPKNRNKNPVRIVDAMGREVETVEQTIKVEVPDDVPLNHNEALRVVREGVADLAHKLEEIDISSDFVLLDEDRLRELDNASRAARAAREDLKQTYENDRTAQLQASMRRSKSSSQLAREVDSRSPTPRVWLWTSIILFQALFIFLLYRFQKRSTRELFLTTYYDPFYPDLHLYGIKYDYITFSRTSPTFTSLSDTLRQEGFEAFCGRLVDMFVLRFADWRLDTWRRWRGDDMQQSVRWPPT